MSEVFSAISDKMSEKFYLAYRAKVFPLFFVCTAIKFSPDKRQSSLGFRKEEKIIFAFLPHLNQVFRAFVLAFKT